jgi:hypothetical protein
MVHEISSFFQKYITPTSPHFCIDIGEQTFTIDKPKQSLLTHMWGFPCWSAAFTRLLHDYIKENQNSPREIFLGDVFNRALELKMNVRAVPFDENGLCMDIGTARELDAALKKFHL